MKITKDSTLKDVAMIVCKALKTEFKVLSSGLEDGFARRRLYPLGAKAQGEGSSK
ncbi:MAG: hypothetical protein OEV42_09820 [Deltaproteobacteria bacterium]|nr:hypothetical protein [Deltaproteobacteria bacterium]